MPGPRSGVSLPGNAVQFDKALGPRRLLELGIFAAHCKSLELDGLPELGKVRGRGCGLGFGMEAACSQDSWQEQRSECSQSALSSHLPRGPTLLQSRQRKREQKNEK